MFYMDNSFEVEEMTKTHSHKEFLLNLENTDPQFFEKLKQNKYEFFWLCNADPDKIEDGQMRWAPYEREDNIYLAYCFDQYEKGNPIKAEIVDYIIDFEDWIKYHKKYNWRERRVVRTTKEKIDFIYRKSRMSYNEFLDFFDETRISQYKIQLR